MLILQILVVSVLGESQCLEVIVVVLMLLHIKVKTTSGDILRIGFAC